MFARYYAQTADLLARGRAPAVPGSADVLTRVLYRTLLRQTHRIEETANLGGSYLSPCVTRHVQAVCALIDTPRTGLRPMSERCERPSELVRQAFRELSDPSPDKVHACSPTPTPMLTARPSPCSPLAHPYARPTLTPRSPHAQAFAALRSAEEVVGWLDANVALHSLAKADQPVEVGACLIADAIESSTEAPAQLAGVQAALDDLAEQVRVHGPGSTPQELLDQINQVGGLQPYVVERATAWHRACNVCGILPLPPRCFTRRALTSMVSRVSPSSSSGVTAATSGWAARLPTCSGLGEARRSCCASSTRPVISKPASAYVVG